MLLFSILSLLFSNAVTTRRDLSILFNRNAMIVLTYCILHHIMSLAIISKGVVGLHGGLLQITNITQIYQIFLFFISIFILQLTSFYPAKWSGKSLITWDKLSNSGDLLKFLIPNLVWKFVGGLTNHLCMVISQEIIERLMEYRGYKSVRYKNLAVKEQRVNGSYNGLINNPMLRCTLKGFERNYQTGIPSKYINTYKYFSSRRLRHHVFTLNLGITPCARSYTFIEGCASYRFSMKTLLTQPAIINSVDNFKINPWFITGFTDAVR